MEDEFIRERIEELLCNIRQQVLVKLIRPYTKVRIHFLSQVRLIYLWIINYNIDVCSNLKINIMHIIYIQYLTLLGLHTITVLPLTTVYFVSTLYFSHNQSLTILTDSVRK